MDAALPERLARAIALAGPMPVSQFMAAANAHYYATRDPLGAGGDFTTAPEISQMFGELVGVWVVDLWERAGKPDAALVELGPGRGTLAEDALRAMARAELTPPVHFVETSAVLRGAQAERVPAATWHDAVTTLPEDRPLLVVANEFFDALPIRQLIRGADGWHERLVACQDVLFLPVTGKRVPDEVIPAHLREAAPGRIIETSPQAIATLRYLARRIAAQGGTLLLIDYGYDGPALGETLQALKDHQPVNPFDTPGEADLTAHVDFATLGAAAALEGVSIHGPISQRDWLGALGIAQRAAALAKRAPDRADEIAAQYRRLTGEDAMGTLFRVMALTHPRWPSPAGFQ